MTVRAFAPAKVNLTLHVTGRRADGYHLLDSLVVFAGVGDWIGVSAAPETRLTVCGPEAGGIPEGPENLVLRAARLMDVSAAIHLDKRLPAAAGIGGGSSDAAATLRALARLGGMAAPDGRSLGADVPVCLRGLPTRMRGIGDALDPLPPLPPAWLVLVNPRAPLATGAVFTALDRRDNAPMPDAVPRWPDAVGLAAWLSARRNDLETPARRLCQPVDAVLSALGETAGCLLARMTGSGATCFGLFGDAAAARSAAGRVAAEHPDWWSAAAKILDDTPATMLS